MANCGSLQHIVIMQWYSAVVSKILEWGAVRGRNFKRGHTYWAHYNHHHRPIYTGLTFN